MSSKIKRRQLLLAALLPTAAQAQWPAAAEGEYRIQRALYGSAERHIDVTDKLREIARSDQRVQLTNQLRIYARGPGGRQRVFEYAEGSFVDGAQFSGWGRGDWGRGESASGQWGGRPGYEDGGAGEYRILEARYGTAQRSVDVTQRLRELARTQPRFLLANESFGIDPARGEVKSLRVSARRGNGAVQVFEYREGSYVDGAQFSDWGAQAGSLEILRAEYGAGRRRSDVTRQLQRLAANGRLALRVDNDSMGGDPARGEAKRLSLRYRINRGREQRLEIEEGQQLSLP